MLLILEYWEMEINQKVWEVNGAFFLMKYTITKSFLEPFSTIIDAKYIFNRLKKRKVTKVKKNEKSEGEAERRLEPETKDYIPRKAYSRMTSKPEVSLEVKYSKAITIMAIDTLTSSATNLSPFVSLFFLVFQYLADMNFYTRRYEDREGRKNFIINQNMIKALEFFPKFVILGVFTDYLDEFELINYDSSLSYVIDFVFIVLMFIPFSKFSDWIYDRFYKEGLRENQEASSTRRRIKRVSGTRTSDPQQRKEKIRYHDVFDAGDYGYEMQKTLIQKSTFKG